MAGYLPKPSFIAGINKAHPLSNGLVLALPISENGGDVVYDKSGNINNGTKKGFTAWSGSAYGSALKFNQTGFSDRVDIPYNPLFRLRDNLTFCVTINYNINPADDKNSYLIDSQNRYSFAIHRTGASNYLGFYSTTTGGSWLTGGPALVINTTYNLALTYSKTDGKLHMYVNGALSASFDISVSLASTTYGIRLGNYLNNYGGGAANWRYAGLIENVLIYNRTLSQSEISIINQDPFVMYRTRRVSDWIGGALSAGATGNPWNYYAQMM